MSQTSQRIISKLKRKVADQDKPENRSNYQQFFKEKLDEPIGLKTPVLRKISNQVFREEAKQLGGQEVLDLCDEFLTSGQRYMRFFSFEWAIKVKKDYLKRDFKRFEFWLKDYVSHWGNCDHLCGGPIGNLLVMYPELSPKRKQWIRSRNRWLRRAAAVSLILPVRRKVIFLNDVFATADALLLDEDDLVQKGYGWMLKEAANLYPDEVFAYVIRYKDEMPRTALRYAIEKYPQGRRKEAMKKG
jgi:3-methyladenine DNA glycosylase AlkD